MRSSIVVLSSLACVALGSLIALIVVGHAFYLRLAAIPTASAEISRYQIVAVADKAFRIDTRTGKVWVYDEEGFEILTPKYLQEHGNPSIAQEKIDKMVREGYAFALPAHWEEVPELKAVEGEIHLRSMPGRKQ